MQFLKYQLHYPFPSEWRLRMRHLYIYILIHLGAIGHLYQVCLCNSLMEKPQTFLPDIPGIYPTRCHSSCSAEMALFPAVYLSAPLPDADIAQLKIILKQSFSYQELLFIKDYFSLFSKKWSFSLQLQTYMLLIKYANFYFRPEDFNIYKRGSI